MIYLNDKPVNVTMFPDNTSQVWKIDQINLAQDDFVHIEWKFENEGELMHLAQLKDLLDINHIKALLKISYLPYARQDKEISNTSTFALRTFAKILNSLKFTEVLLTDPHSKMALKLIKNSRILYNFHLINQIFDDTKSDLLCYPDKGAVDKYNSLIYISYIFGNKIRNPLTGLIISYTLDSKIDPKGKKILIVDDICDGGATFILLTRELYNAGALEVNLYVSHGIFSKGTQVLKDSGIKHIFTKHGEVL